MKICIVGSGHVGLVTGACLAHIGHDVVCVDSNAEKIKMLNKNEIPLYEPDLEKIVKECRKNKRLAFTTSLADGVKKSEVIFVSVNTPPKPDGSADMYYVEKVSRDIAKNTNSYKLIVEKSTVPIQTGDWVKKTIKLHIKKGVEFDIASNPEFLREGKAVEDFLRPDRIVIGVENKRAENILRQVYKKISAPIVVTDIGTSELIKHASNSFLSMKISFINAISVICDLAKTDVAKVAEGVGLDKRIGKAFLNAGLGYGGMCFPKDLSAFIRLSESLGYDFKLLKAVREINDEQKRLFVKKIEDAIWNIPDKTIGVLGLAFKPGTEDMRSAPSIDMINMLKHFGAKIKAYDPKAMPIAKNILKDVKFCKDAYEVAKGSDCLAIVTEWDEFKNLDFKKLKKLMNQPVIIDGRNMLSRHKMAELGFEYYCVGRPKI